jgi:hypothetical protein
MTRRALSVTLGADNSLLARVARINLRRTVREFFNDLFGNPANQPIDTTPEAVFLADRLRFTRDPFDALIGRRRRPQAFRSSPELPIFAAREPSR